MAVKIAKATLDRADELMRRAKADPFNDGTIYAVTVFTRGLEHDAYYAYLDGKAARAKALNQLAARVTRTALKAQR
jgi:hypothetical protein